jgi:hypothetical protein
LFEVSRRLGDWTCNQYGLRQVDGQQSSSSEVRLSFVCHSMGGIVAAVALVRGHINPDNVDHFISIGTPFLGAPAAFRALYDLGYLPGLDWVERVVNFCRRRRASRKNMLDAFQSFPSTYQLLPHSDEHFVDIIGKGKIHPFDVMDNRYTKQAIALHQQMQRFNGSIDEYHRTNKIQFCFIHANDPDTTDSIFRASQMGTGFDKVQCRYRTEGDGTVEDVSGSLHYEQDNVAVEGVKHGYMCENRRVVDIVMARLGRPERQHA